MTTHPPAVGDLPQPTQYNDNRINTLQAEIGPNLAFALEEPKRAEPMALRCDLCEEIFGLSEGYFFLDDFICDVCIYKLAENGEFYCGS